ncbi:SEC-C domain-containing protein [Burkholderiaceae bacterium DAT-1]|nr:SEC-C domain-containing protein [Burkholderiaceae bacterium DAT-1]
MSKHAFPVDCPCGSGKLYKECCFMYHMEKEFPPTAEALMRSRYSAYVMRKSDYLRFSWYPDTCPKDLDLSDEKIKWVGLQIIGTQGGQPGDGEGVVEFIAKYKIGGRAAKIHEKSTFTRLKGRWVYLDGVVDGEDEADA